MEWNTDLEHRRRHPPRVDCNNNNRVEVTSKATSWYRQTPAFLQHLLGNIFFKKF